MRARTPVSYQLAQAAPMLLQYAVPRSAGRCLALVNPREGFRSALEGLGAGVLEGSCVFLTTIRRTSCTKFAPNRVYTAHRRPPGTV